MDVADQVIFFLCCLVALGTAGAVGYLLGKQNRQPTRIVPVARKVDNRYVPGKFSREERRAHKRRRR